MYNYYCKNCKHIIGELDDYYIYKFYDITIFCEFIQSKNIDSIYFLDCKNCNKFIGIECHHVCKNCFGKYPIIEEENLFNFFFKYKKIKSNCVFNNCKFCKDYKFRLQYWFFGELTFYK